MASGTTAGRARSWAVPRVDLRILIGIGLVAVALAGGLTLANSLRITDPFVVAARTIPAGHVIEAADLAVGEARLEGSLGALAFAGSDLASIVGQTAGRPIHEGALVLRPDLGAGPVLGPDDVAVTVAMSADAVFGNLRRGDQVAVMATSEPGRPQSQTGTLLERATVYHVAFDASRVSIGGGGGSEEDGRITNVTLVVPRAEAEAVTHALVNGRLTLLPVAPAEVAR
ncbi:MAG: hypothetical protein CVU47_01335 [Chloroflexi bacterium HGW-Chloroflexi-9]|nr:MAG: hypothetical protein CVU47_01335 [Chloroflexi bacterium HGW-Chloroflexi-9]